MASLGRACLLLALIVCAYGIGASIYGARSGRLEWSDSGRRAVYALAAILTVGYAILEIAFLRNDFAFKAVYDTSSRTTPEFYRAVAVWSSQEGSLLLWAWLMSLWSSLALFLTRKRMREIASYAQAILLGLAGFFICLMIGYANPFSTISPLQHEGVGLDPLLRHPSMAIHPPMLYSGYTLGMIPLAFGLAALITRKVDVEWLSAVRRFAMAAWFFLGVGVLLGARWSYSELGWGGYWGWDPVENAALMPWLTATAFLHSRMIQEKRGMLKVWNVSLVLATGILTLMGTFLVRSGVLDSIHAFGGHTLGVPFVCLIGLLIVVSIYLVYTRRDILKSENRIDSLLSRESIFLGNNLLLVGLCFVIFWGTYFPLISEAITGRQASVGPPWFDRYTVPLGLMLVLLAGIGPLMAWRRATLANARRNFLLPITAALITLAALLGAGIDRKPLAITMFCVGAFVAACVAQEFWRGVRVRRAMAHEAIPLALISLVQRNRRRYGGYIVHLGIVVLLVGVAASTSFQHVNQLQLSVGQCAKVGSYNYCYVKPTVSLTAKTSSERTGETLSLGGVLKVYKEHHYIATLKPEEGYYSTLEPGKGVIESLIGGTNVSHVAINSTITRDLWAAVEPDIEAPNLEHFITLGDKSIPKLPPKTQTYAAAYTLVAIAKEYLKNPPPASFNLIESPLVMWIWLGGIIVACGGLIAMWPAPSSVRRRIGALGRSRAGLARA